MYCRNCGKELSNVSNFCPECGTKQNDFPENKIHVPKFIKEHQKLSYVYVAWFILHLSLFIFSEKTANYFYPFGCELKDVFVNFPYVDFSLLKYSDSYDFSELFFYTILFPIMIFGAFKSYPYVLLYWKRAKEHYIQWKEANGEKEHIEILSEESQEKTNDVAPFSLGWTGQSSNEDKKVSGKDGEDNSDSALQAYENAINSIDPSGGTGCMTITAIIGSTLLLEFFISLIPYSDLPALPKALIQMAIGCVSVYLIRLYLNVSEEKREIQGDYTYNEMPLYQRFLGSLIDKFIIVFLFVVLNIIIHPYQAPGDLGIYRSMLSTPPVIYENIDRAIINEGGGDYMYGETPYIGLTMDFGIRMTIMLVVVYLLYHLIFEISINTSPCKKLFNGILLRKDGERLRLKNVLYRMIIRGVLFFLAIYGIHVWMECTYYCVFVILLLFVDIPLFFSHRSTIDILSGTMYMKRVKDDSSSEELHYEVNIVQDTNSDIKSDNDNNIINDNEVIKDENSENVENVNADDEEDDDMGNHTKKRIFMYILASVLFVGSIATWQYWSDIVEYFTGDNTRYGTCPELVVIANKMNSDTPFTLTDGIEVAGVTYKDTVFTLFYQIDSEIVQFDKISAFQKDQKHAALTAIRASTGKTREEYEKYVEYHVTKVDKYIDKRTGKSVTITISPSEIKTALQEPLSALGRLEQYINMEKKILPYEIEEGFIAKKIEMVGGQVVMDISVDEDMYDFYDIIEIKDEFRSNLINQLTMDPVRKMLCKYLGEAHYGLAFRYYGNQSYLEMFITLDADEIISLLEE